MTDDLSLRVAPVSDLEPPAHRAGHDEGATPELPPAWLVTNPPWGGRVAGGGDLRNLYARFGAVARERLTGGRLVVLAADPALAGHTGLRLTELFATDSGGVPVQALTAPLDAQPASAARSRRRPRPGAGTPADDR